MPRMATMTCPVCRRDFDYPAKQHGRKYCGHKCKFKIIGAVVRAAANTPEAKRKNGDALRGRGKGNGYVKRGGRHEHRMVMEEKLGRPLVEGEIVHHDDEIKSNNLPDNLILTDRVEHGRIHNLGRKRPLVTVCKYGHELLGDNVRITSAGARRCVTCARAYDNEWKKQQRRQRNQRGMVNEG